MKRAIHISIALALILWEMGVCQENLQALDAAYKAGSTRALSMGGVYIATNRGVEALVGNPGGLARINGRQLSLQGAAQIYRKSDLDEAEYKKRMGYFEYAIKYGMQYQFKNIGLAFPISIPNTKIRLAGAVGYHTFYDWDYNRTVKSWKWDGIAHFVKEKQNRRTRGLLDVLSFGFGAAISEKGSFGISVNFPLWRRYDQTAVIMSTLYNSESREEWDVSADRFVQLGGLFRLTSRWAVGISALMKHGFVIENGKSENNYDGEVHRSRIDRKTQWEIPSVIDLGISCRVKANLLVACDIQSRAWENIKINDLSLGKAKNGNAYRFGLEYGQKALFRTGFALDRLPVLDADDQPVDLKNVTAGVGLKFNRLLLDLGASYKFVTFEVERWNSRWDYRIRELMIHTTLTYGGFER